jgi:hypothetical protein
MRLVPPLPEINMGRDQSSFVRTSRNAEMSDETKDRIGSAPPAQRNPSVLSPVLKARRVKHPRSQQEIVADAEKKFSKTLAYLAK